MVCSVSVAFIVHQHVNKYKLVYLKFAHGINVYCVNTILESGKLTYDFNYNEAAEFKRTVISQCSLWWTLAKPVWRIVCALKNKDIASRKKAINVGVLLLYPVKLGLAICDVYGGC